MKRYFQAFVVVFLYVLDNQCLNSTKVFKEKKKFNEEDTCFYNTR